MVPASKVSLNLFDCLDSESRHLPQQKDEVIASNLYFVSLPYSLGLLSGVTDENQRKEMCRKNNWLHSVVPEAQDIPVLNVDKIKEYIPEYKMLQSCDAFFYSPAPGKCFLLEFKAIEKEKLLKMLDLNTDDKDAIIKKVTHSKTILEAVHFNREEIPDDIVPRTHVVIVYDGKNTEASSGRVRDLLPQKKKCVTSGKQRRASFQGRSSRKEIEQPTKRFAEYIRQKLGFCAVTKKELPGFAYPDDNPRCATFMTVQDFAKAVDSLFAAWDWGDYFQYFTYSVPAGIDVAEKTLDPV